MPKKIIIEFRRSDALTLYSTKSVGEQLCDFEIFLDKHNNGTESVRNDLLRLLKAMERVFEAGAEERRFRTSEGKMSDRLCALPIETGSLRLYCLRISDTILIVGGGGVKRTRKYQDSPELNQIVETLQKIDKQLFKLEKKGVIFVSDTKIEGIENVVTLID